MGGEVVEAEVIHWSFMFFNSLNQSFPSFCFLISREVLVIDS